MKYSVSLNCGGNSLTSVRMRVKTREVERGGAPPSIAVMVTLRSSGGVVWEQAEISVVIKSEVSDRF